ncbi:hypothetical protein [Caulobacter hibisci]|uniref:Uncharacterized protein n=1 Tax=Caulobacter hibisci TaxID=2035993 RepID=A0ABS0SYE7_9CAUL|nr:hypothetical protein [Caulobacter hibisci]MBI1684464.1 hypothetical protein [Caulobacter hibisci]
MGVLPRSAPRAERPSTAQVDFGGVSPAFDAVARGVAQVGEQRLKRKTDEAERWADQQFQTWRTENDARVAASQASYDGAAPGLTAQELAQTDASFSPLVGGEGDLLRRDALQRRFDGYRAQVGNSLSQVEAAKRAEPLALQAKARDDAALSVHEVGFATDFAGRQKVREAGGLAAVTAAGRLEDYDAASKAAIEAAPEALRPRLQAKLAAKRADEFVLGQRVEEDAVGRLVGDQTAQGLDTLVNTLLSNPAAYGQAKGLVPQLAATIADPAQRQKFEASAHAAMSAGFVQGLINEGQLGTAKALLDGGKLDKDLDPTRKQAFIDQLEVAQRAGARRARIAAGGNGDEDDDDGGGWSGVNLPGGPSFENLKNGYASDPLKYAQKKGKAPVEAMDPNAGLIAGAGDGAWGRTLQQRRGVGMQLTKADGVQQRMLTNAEVTFYKDAFEREPAARFRVAQEARKAVGALGAQDLLREIGVNDELPVSVAIAQLAAGGASSFAEDARRGLGLKDQGAALTRAEKASLASELDPYRALYADRPEIFQALIQAAEAAYTTHKVAGTTARPEWYALRALGGFRVNDTTYGGGKVVRRQATVLPDWLNPDYLDDAMETLGSVWAAGDKGPRYGNREPMSARDIAKGVPVPVGGGWFQLRNGSGDPALRANGQPFMFKFDDNRRFLGKRLGGKAVRGAQ